MTMRYAAFLLSVLAGVGELAGSIIGLGVARAGFAFGGGGLIDASTAVGMAMVLGVATIFAAVAVMLVRDPRPAGILIAVAALGCAVAGGPWAAVAAAVALGAAFLTGRIDRTAISV
jgi:hypothetical protein